MRLNSSKSLLALLSLGAMTALVATAHAATSATDATIHDLTIEGNNFARVSFDTPSPISGSRPACHSSSFPTHYALDISTDKGKAMLSTLTAALLSGKAMSVIGAGSCTTLLPGSTSLETLSVLTLRP